jgi:hypothetical protein
VLRHYNVSVVWNEPIEIRKLWRGLELRTPYATYSCTWFVRIGLILAFAIFGLFLLAMIAFEILLLVHDPLIALACWAIVGAVAAILCRKKPAHPETPDDPTEGTGIPIARIPPPLSRVGSEAKELQAPVGATVNTPRHGVQRVPPE